MKIKYLILFGISVISCILIYNSTYDKKAVEIEPLQSGNIQEEVLYYGKTKQELINQINNSLSSTLTGKGEVIVNYCLEYGVDPYIATAIILHETGCKNGCSTLVIECNNVAGQVAKPSCNGTSYKRYDTLDEGIKGAIYNMYVNYVKYDLLTPEQMGPKYAEDPKWASKVNEHINEIKSK